MNHLIKNQGSEIKFLTDVLRTHVDNYRLLVASAAELNNIYEARSSQVKTTIKRAEAVGEIIDQIVDIIQDCAVPYFEYCKVKGKFIHSKTTSDQIFTEVTNELSFQNSSDRDFNKEKDGD